LYLIIFLLPFIVLYWFVPFFSTLSVGSDYQSYGIENQMELLFSIEKGSFPLYSPGYALGQSSIALTWSQIFHPIAFLAYIMPGYWNGKALYWHSFYKLLSLGGTHLVLFVLLRRLKLNTVFAFVVSFVTVYNLRMLDLIRFGPALEAFTANLLLCASLSWFMLYPSQVRGPVGIAAATYLLVTSGHPQMMYYGLLGAVLYLIVVPFLQRDISGEQLPGLRNTTAYWSRSLLFMGIGVLCSSAYVVPLHFDFYATNTLRVGASYEWGSTGTQSVIGVISNFFFPFLSDVHGAFGGSSLLLPALLIPLLAIMRITVPRSVWAAWGVVMLIILFMLGPRTPVHKIAWEHLPFMSAFRNPGRISIVLPVLLMLLLAWIVRSKDHPVKTAPMQGHVLPMSLFFSLCALTIPPYIILYYLLRPELGFLPPVKIHNVPAAVIAVSLAAGICSLFLLAMHNRHSRAGMYSGALICLLVIIQTVPLLRYGTIIVPAEDRLTIEEIEAQKRDRLDYRYHDLPGMQTAAVIEQVSNSFFEPYLAKIYTQVIPVESSREAYRLMENLRLPQQVFVEGFDSVRAKVITDNAHAMKQGHVELIYSSYNRMEFRVSAEEETVLGFSQPFTGHWKAFVNGRRVPLYRANGAAHAVEIPGGENVVEFRYWSSAYFWGILLSCLTLAAGGSTLCFLRLGGVFRTITSLLILAAGSGIFILWYNSLYTGDNLETEYTWTYSPPLERPNLAYGKKTSGYELPSTSYLIRHRSTAVDGNTAPGSGFTLKPDSGQELIIDLHRVQRIGTIIVYGESARCPEITVSHDGTQWSTANGSSLCTGENSLFMIEVNSHLTARLIKVSATDSEVSIDEVEIYEPGEQKP
jgi:hypothetical protein